MWCLLCCVIRDHGRIWDKNKETWAAYSSFVIRVRTIAYAPMRCGSDFLCLMFFQMMIGLSIVLLWSCVPLVLITPANTTDQRTGVSDIHYVSCAWLWIVEIFEILFQYCVRSLELKTKWHSYGSLGVTTPPLCWSGLGTQDTPLFLFAYTGPGSKDLRTKLGSDDPWSQFQFKIRPRGYYCQLFKIRHSFSTWPKGLLLSLWVYTHDRLIVA